MRNFGVKDSDRLIAYLEHKLKDVTGDQKLIVEKIPEVHQDEDGPKLIAKFSGEQQNINTLGSPPRNLQSTLEDIFPCPSLSHLTSTVFYTAQEEDPSKAFNLNLFVLNFHIAVSQAEKNDPETFRESQKSLQQHR